jgi:putative peptidoglycan lipid II flippase
MLLAAPLLATFFHYGAFGEQDVRMSSEALVAFSFGLLGFILVKVLAPGFYARQDTKTPVRIGVIAMGVNIALSVVLVFVLKHTGLALAISLSAFVNAGLLYRPLRRDGFYTPGAGWMAFLVRVSLATAAMGVLLVWGMGDLRGWFAASVGDRALHLAALVIGGAGLYLVTLWLVGIRPRDLMHRPAPSNGPHG